MNDGKPRPPLLGRVPPGAWPALTWCAALIVALAIFTAGPSVPPPGDRFLHPGRPAWAVLAAVCALPLGLAGRRPVPILGLVLAETLVSPLFGLWPWMALLPVADLLVLYVAATWARPRPPVKGSSGREARKPGPGAASGRRTAAGAAVAVAAVQVVSWRMLNGSWQPGALHALPAMLLATVLAWTAGNAISQRRAYAEALRAQAATRAVQAERLRIARELHDMVAHSIGVIAIQAGAAAMVIETQPTGARTALSAIETTSRETLAGLRRMLVALRHAEPGADAACPAPGLADVDALAATAADAGVRVEVQRHGQRRPLSPETDMSAFRIVQESVTNVLRHANARHCWVRVEYREGEVTVEITDDGRATVSEDRGRLAYGIAGMRERTALLNGWFSAGPMPGGGFRVAAGLPT